MADFPYLPLWTDAYLADTTHLRTEEHGAYLLLLFAAWRAADCGLPDDDDALARLAGLPPQKWKSMKAVVMAFWSLDKRRKRWVQKRLKIEREKASEKRGKARGSAASRWKQTKSGDANAMRTQCYPEPEPYPDKKPDGFLERAGARKNPKGWIERKTHSQALDNIIDRLNEHEHERNEGSGGIAQAPVQLLPNRRTG